MSDYVYVTWVQREAAREIIANAQIDDAGRYVVAPADQAS